VPLISAINRALILTIGPLIILLISIWFYLQGGRFVTTENAYLKSEIISVTSELSAKVDEVLVQNNDRVSKDEVVVRLRDETFTIAVAGAEANLANVKAELESQKAQYESSLLEIVSALTNLEFATLEKERMRQLLDENSISVAQYDQAEFRWKSASNELEAKHQALKVIEARLIDPLLPIETHPLYLQALSRLDDARVDLYFVDIRAPADGVATNLSVHEGENILTGTNLFSIVDDSNIWIEANFKETDLTYVRTNQPVVIVIDTYPNEEWSGSVASITPATGSEFSLLPAQNSSGNWVKVVQRIMVKIELNTQENSLPLAAGMSAEVSIDTAHKRSLPWVSERLTEYIRGL
jgi:membrane fusion protein (multidrug efflux system)